MLIVRINGRSKKGNFLTKFTMGKVRHKHVCGLTLVEVIVSMIVITVASVGALAHQYLGAQHLRIAHAELTATRTGQLLLEDWKGAGGIDLQNYDATALNLGFVRPAGGESADYVITVDGVKMYIWLSYHDVAVDSFAGVTLRQISVKLRWRNDLGHGAIEDNDPTAIFTTYCRLGAG